MKKILAFMLLLCMLFSVMSVTAVAAEPLAGDINGDGKVSPYDALQVQAYLHGEITLSQQQLNTAIAACPSISELSTAHIIAIFFKPLAGLSEQAPEADGMFHIRYASDMELMRSFPYAAFSLDADIDMSRQTWSPFIFHGYLMGNGHTISNLSVTADENNINAGALFVKLGTGLSRKATVQDLTLASPALTTTATHQYAGLVCGSNYGTIENVSITNGSIGGAINSKTKYVGAQTGMNYGTVRTGAQTQIDLGYAATTADGVVGGNSADGTTSYNGEISYTKEGITVLDVETREPVPMSRQAVVNAMYSYSQVRWKSPKACSVKESDVTFTIYKYNNYKLYPDYYYVGLPYSHALGSMDAFMDDVDSYDSNKKAYLIKNNEFIVDPNDDSTEYLDSLFLGHIMGMDCSSAVLSAWRTVCTDAEAQSTSGLTPTASNTNSYGVVKVGNYDIPDKSYATKVISGVPDYSTSWDVNFKVNKDLKASERNYLYCSVVSNDDGSINQDKLKNLYAAYALCRPGDAINASCYGYLNSDKDVTMRSAGHSRLVSKEPIVTFDADGNIDPEHSYLITIEQGGGGGGINGYSGNGENGDKYSSWGVNIQYSFRELAGIENATAEKPNYLCYVPLTMPELNNAYREPTQFKLKNSSDPLHGIVASNYAITYTELTIDGTTDKQFTGQYVKGTKNIPYEARDESGTTVNSTANFNRVMVKSVNLQKHAAAFSSLASGTHTYSLTVKLATGETKTYTGTFTT